MTTATTSVAETLAEAAEKTADARDTFAAQMQLFGRSVRALAVGLPPAARPMFNRLLGEFDRRLAEAIATSVLSSANLRTLARELRSLPADQQIQVH